MAVVDASAEGTAGAVAEVPAPQPEAPPVTGLLAGDPMALGLPVFIAGSAALGLTLAGMVPGSPLGAPLAIIMAATGIGLSVATAWAIAVGQSAVASVFGIFAGFWLSFAALVLGLNHNWFVLPAASVTRTVELFLTVWLIVIAMLTLATLRLPVAYTALFALVAIALLLVLLGTSTASSGLTKTGGVVVLVFAALGVYLYFGTAAAATGGAGVPLGKPLLRR
jgi:succinate-acetate transporter protein